MNLEGIVLGMFFYSTIIVSLIGETCAKNKYYKLTTTHKETEEKVFFNLYHQKTLFGLMKNAVVDMLPNICNIWWEEKLKFCQDILEADKNGFHLIIHDPEHLNCNNKSLLVHFLTRSTLQSSKLSVFFCPQICYEDLETNELKCLPHYTYAVSQALEHTSASIFVRRDLQSAWYTRHHVTDIDFKRIESSGDESETSNSVPEVNDDDLIKLYLQAKRISSPYEKFKRFFSSINLCGLRRADKVYLCRSSIEEAFNTKTVEFDFLGYNEQACKKYVISPFEKNDDENNFQRQNEVTMVRCPPIKEFSDYISPMRKYFDLYYIASNLKYHSTTLFIRRNRKGKLPTQEANIENLPIKPMTQDIRRWRFLHSAFKTKYRNIQGEKSYQEVEREMLNSVEGDVRMPSTLARLDQTNLEMLEAGGLLKSSLDKWQADDSVIAFSKVRMMKSIYGRFIETYRSIDVGLLSVRQKAVLCNDALKYYENRRDIYRIPETFLFKHSRERIRLTRREAEGLKTDLFLLFQCPCDIHSAFGLFFVGKNHLKNTATIYKVVQIRSKPYYYPYAFVTHINRYELAYSVVRIVDNYFL